jgi:hypothetical protein
MSHFEDLVSKQQKKCNDLKQKCIDIMKQNLKPCVNYFCQNYKKNNPCKMHNCSQTKIVHAFLKSFLDVKLGNEYVLIEPNVLMVEHFVINSNAILYICSEGFGLVGTIQGFISYEEDPFICATLINLVHAYYKESKENPNVNYVVENFPQELIQKTVFVLSKMNLINNEEKSDDVIELCSKVDLSLALYKYYNLDIGLLASFINKWHYYGLSATSLVNDKLMSEKRIHYTKIIIYQGLDSPIIKYVVNYGDSNGGLDRVIQFIHSKKTFNQSEYEDLPDKDCRIVNEIITDYKSNFHSTHSTFVKSMHSEPVYGSTMNETYQEYFNVLQ